MKPFYKSELRCCFLYPVQSGILGIIMAVQCGNQNANQKQNVKTEISIDNREWTKSLKTKYKTSLSLWGAKTRLLKAWAPFRSLCTLSDYLRGSCYVEQDPIRDMDIDIEHTKEEVMLPRNKKEYHIMKWSFFYADCSQIKQVQTLNKNTQVLEQAYKFKARQIKTWPLTTCSCHSNSLIKTHTYTFNKNYY